jgi:hypothetical protein
MEQPFTKEQVMACLLEILTPEFLEKHRRQAGTGAAAAPEPAREPARPYAADQEFTARDLDVALHYMASNEEADEASQCSAEQSWENAEHFAFDFKRRRAILMAEIEAERAAERPIRVEMPTFG